VTVLGDNEEEIKKKHHHHHKNALVSTVENPVKHITIVGGGNAAGDSLPTMLIFNGKSVPRVSPA
jgi:hypothetical protein